MSDGEEPFDEDDDDEAYDDVVRVEDEARVASLTAVELQVIDASILSHATVHWKKVLVIVSLMRGDDENSLPDQFYVRRVARLAAARKLESQGDLRRMRHSEVRLPGSYDWPRA